MVVCSRGALPPGHDLVQLCPADPDTHVSEAPLEQKPLSRQKPLSPGKSPCHQPHGRLPPDFAVHSCPSSVLEGGSLTPVRDSPCTPRLRSVSSYGNIRAVTTARSLNKSLQNLSLTEEREPGGWALARGGC